MVVPSGGRDLGRDPEDLALERLRPGQPLRLEGRLIGLRGDPDLLRLRSDRVELGDPLIAVRDPGRLAPLDIQRELLGLRGLPDRGDPAPVVLLEVDPALVEVPAVLLGLSLSVGLRERQ